MTNDFDDDGPLCDVIDLAFSCATFEVVKDAIPVEDGGYRPGARFMKDHLRWMYKSGGIDPLAIVRNFRTGVTGTVESFKLAEPHPNDDKKKIQDEDIPRIKSMYASGVRQYRIAEMFGVGTSQIGRILRGKSRCIPNGK